MAAPMRVAAAAEAVASNAGRYGAEAWQAFKARSPSDAKAKSRGIRESLSSVKPSIRAPRQLTSKSSKTAGRNSQGRITIFHRGGGAKRLYRKIDLKRSTSSMGVIERIEYDPNRSARIALVRWEDAHPHFQRRSNAEHEFVPPQKSLELTTATTRGVYSLSSLSREVDRKKVVQAPPKLQGTYAMIGVQTGKLPELQRVSIEAPGSVKTCARDVFLSAFSTQRCDRKSESLNIPRITVAGAKPTYYAAQMREKAGNNSFSLGEIQRWDTKSSMWEHRLKPKAAVSWHSSRANDSLSFGESAKSNEKAT
ncbi:50S ribosomal protein L2 [Euphorbia peplus]|nr:50S ribosomal protein L2 [Euphorbia peplus]